jgi:hypothetical protein
MATIETDRPRSQTSSRKSAYRESETKLSLKTTEFWAMAGVIATILVAAAVSDSLGDVRAWTLVAGVAAAYIISRGLAKAGSRYTDEQGPSNS